MEQLFREDLIKHWLLNTAIDFPRPLLHVLPVVRGITLNAKEIPGRAPGDYAHALQELYLSGHVQWTSEDRIDDIRSISRVDAILDRFLRYPFYARGERQVGPREPKIPRVEFALTESGGALRGRIAKPDWDHYHGGSSDYKTGDAVSPDLALLMARLGWFSELSNETIDIGSLEIEECSDYPVLYWKRLPHVYRATFKCHVGQARWKKQGRSEYPLEPDWFRKWWHSTAHFYTHP